MTIHTIGIDLGTTYSCVYTRSGGIERLISASDDGELTPSVVYFDTDGSILVGAEAKSRVGDDPDNVVVGIKREMGRDFPLQFGQHVLTPEGVSALILKRLATDAARELSCNNADLRAVITVPAYFGVAEKEATYVAARIAGLDCMELLAEPVAAGYAYGIDELSNGSALVFDLGGGTFDVAVVGVDAGTPRVWAVDGETKLGGLDWDRRLTSILWEQLARQSDDIDDLRDDDHFVGELMSISEQIKRQLSRSASAPKQIRYGKRKYSLSVSRADFEEATRDLVLQCGQSVARVTAAASAAGAPPISRVLLVGGSTRMPMIRDFLDKSLKVPVAINDPDKAVARGASILAEQLGSQQSVNRAHHGGLGPVRIASVLPRAIGMFVHSSMEPWRPDPYVRAALAANMPLPITDFEISVATILDNQEKARIRLYEQGGAVLSEMVDDNRLIFDGEVSDIPKGAGGSEIKILISVGLDGRIDVRASSAKRKALPMECFIEGVLDDDAVADQASVVGRLMLTD